MGDEISGNIFIVIGLSVSVASLLNISRLAFFLVIGLGMIAIGFYKKTKKKKEVPKVQVQHHAHQQKQHAHQKQSAYCARCGTKLGANFNFCARCGTRLR